MIVVVAAARAVYSPPRALPYTDKTLPSLSSRYRQCPSAREVLLIKVVKVIIPSG